MLFRSSNDGFQPNPAKDYDLTAWDTTRNTDWQKNLIGGTAQYNNVSGSVSGGNSNLQYLIGGTFHRETTVFSNNFFDNKGAVHFNINNVSENQKFRIQLTANYMIDNNQLPQTDLTGVAVKLAPDAPTLYDSSGNLNWEYNASGSPTWSNPVANYYARYINKTTNLIANATLSYQIDRKSVV